MAELVANRTVTFNGGGMKSIPVPSGMTYVTIRNQNNTNLSMYNGNNSVQGFPFGIQTPNWERTYPLENDTKYITIVIELTSTEQHGLLNIMFANYNLGYNTYIGGFNQSSIDITGNTVGLLEKDDLSFSGSGALNVDIGSNTQGLLSTSNVAIQATTKKLMVLSDESKKTLVASGKHSIITSGTTINTSTANKVFIQASPLNTDIVKMVIAGGAEFFLSAGDSIEFIGMSMTFSSIAGTQNISYMAYN